VNNDHFDALAVRTSGVISRRTSVQVGISALLASVLGASLLSDAPASQTKIENKHRQKRRRKHHKKWRDHCRLQKIAGGAKACGDGCCPRRFGVCCDDPRDPSGKSCHRGGEVCCPSESGGACETVDECCPPGFSNDVNGGCCPVGSLCCSNDEDCFALVGDPDSRCTEGCCVGP
jgi:hypothetical protein